jgi:[acyl-carrier-protein] S-malonyltransferase
MKRIAFVFPGQGSQYVGMGKEFEERYPLAKDHFREAEEALGIDMRQLCLYGPEEALKMTANTQPALLLCSVIAFRLLEENGIRPDFVAGHSLGEYSALVAGGSLRFADALHLVRKRGEFMQEAVPLGRGAMAAILGMEREAVARICEEAQEGQVVEIANLNSPGQIVISGEAEAVERAVKAAKQHGARRAVSLPVSAPFHCRLMKPAGERLGEILAQTEVADPKIPLVTNVDAQLTSSTATIRSALLRQASSPVLWEDSIGTLQDQGVDTFVEVGPGTVLSGLIKRIAKEATLRNVEDEQSLRSTIEALGGRQR